MPDADAIRTTIHEYVAHFPERDRWLELWAPDATMEDPVGSPIRHGRDAVAAFYDESTALADTTELTLSGEPIVVGAEAAFAFDIRVTIGEAVLGLSVIDVMTFDDEARITSQRAFVDMAAMKPL